MTNLYTTYELAQQQMEERLHEILRLAEQWEESDEKFKKLRWWDFFDMRVNMEMTGTKYCGSTDSILFEFEYTDPYDVYGDRYESFSLPYDWFGSHIEKNQLKTAVFEYFTKLVEVNDEKL